MLIFIYGPDGYRLKQRTDEIVAKYRQKHQSGANFFSLDFSDYKSADTLKDIVKNVSFFDEIKLVICRNVFASKTGAENILGIIKEFGLTDAKETVLLVAENAEEKTIQ